jgi:hypothetical protein
LVAVTLVGMLALLFFLGFSDFGANPTSLLIVLGGFAALGIAALLALVLGFCKSPDVHRQPSWADQFMDEDVAGRSIHQRAMARSSTPTAPMARSPVWMTRR